MSSKFPSNAILSSIVQEVALKRSGLVADCIFPQVKVPACEFSVIDWEKSLEALKPVDSSVTCKSDVKQVDAEPFELKQHKIKEHSLSQSLDECCVQICGENVYPINIVGAKTTQLTNRHLINREIETVQIATDVSKYTDRAGNQPEATNSEGAKYDLALASIFDANFDLLRYFQGIQQDNYITGNRNTMVISQKVLNGMLRHPTFRDIGCIGPQMTTLDGIASLLGLAKVCVADSAYNTGLAASVAMTPFWNPNLILFTASYELLTSTDAVRSFGVSANMKGFRQYTNVDWSKGPDSGVTMQKISHDFTPIVLDYKAATLVNLTT